MYLYCYFTKKGRTHASQAKFFLHTSQSQQTFIPLKMIALLCHNNDMIRKKSLNFKSFQSNTSPESIFSDFMASFIPEKETCPYCSSRGNCIRHAWYERNLVWFDGHSQICFRIRILRVKCETCGHTHAILPDIIVPYASYGVQFILTVLSDFFERAEPVSSICLKYDISEVLLYRWLRIFKSDKHIYLGSLNHSQTSGLQFLQKILNNDFCEFSMDFILHTAKSFLQSHRNPAVYRQTVF